LDFTDALGNSVYSFIWLIFVIFIGIALAVDIGVLGKARKFVNKRATKSSNKDRNKNLSDQEEKESKVIIPLHKESSLEQKQLQTFRRAFYWTILWISLAGIFAIIIYLALGQEKALLFATGYVLEKSLSVDNMFVFLLIFSSLGIPYIYQHKVLMAGILSAIAMRIGLILAGVSLLESFHWMIYVFGGLLLFTGYVCLSKRKKRR
jgi:tellurite resistance protein TerC